MEKIIKLFGYELLKNIKIKYWFKRTPPKKEKMRRKLDYYNRTGRYESKVVLDRKNRLIDGYTSYLIAKKNGKKIIKVKRKK